MDIRVYRYMIIGKIVGHKTAESIVGQRLFVQRHSNAADHRAEVQLFRHAIDVKRDRHFGRRWQFFGSFASRG